jgi:hypothetical protein
VAAWVIFIIFNNGERYDKKKKTMDEGVVFSSIFVRKY